LLFYRIRKFQGDTVRFDAVNCLTYKMREFHPAMKNWQGMDRAEMFQMEAVRHAVANP
jgi:hypothetical protein